MTAHPPPPSIVVEAPDATNARTALSTSNGATGTGLSVREAIVATLGLGSGRQRTGRRLRAKGFVPDLPLLLVPGFTSTVLRVEKSTLAPAWEGRRVWLSLRRLGYRTAGSTAPRAAATPSPAPNEPVAADEALPEGLIGSPNLPMSSTASDAGSYDSDASVREGSFIHGRTRHDRSRAAAQARALTIAAATHTRIASRTLVAFTQARQTCDACAVSGCGTSSSCRTACPIPTGSASVLTPACAQSTLSTMVRARRRTLYAARTNN